ncbi:MAG: tetratricopeptide repeat protein, partial [Trichodesmium sp.]
FNRDELIDNACKWMSDYLKNNPNLEEKERHLCGEIEPSATAFFLKGEKLAAELKFKEAFSQFEQAIKLDSNFSLNVARLFLRMGRKFIIEYQEVEVGIALLKQAQKWEPDIDLNPDTEEIDRDPEKVAKQFVAFGKVKEGVRLAEEGKIESAISLYKEAQKLDSDVEISANDWNSLCWFGSLDNQAQNVMFACEKAVKFSPNDGDIIDSRGLARALTGDFPGAISDFQAFVEWTKDDELKAKRQGWIDSLKKGENPFTSEVLEELLNE